MIADLILTTYGAVAAFLLVGFLVSAYVSIGLLTARWLDGHEQGDTWVIAAFWWFFLFIYVAVVISDALYARWGEKK